MAAKKVPPFHKGKPEATDVHLATLHMNAWNEEMFPGLPSEPEITRRYIHRLAQLIRYVRRTTHAPAKKKRGT